MRYAEYPPSPALAAIVDRYWILEGSGGGAPEPIFPDGRVEIILHFGDPFVRQHPNGENERQPDAFLVGQMREPICVGATGSAGVAGIRLRPAGSRSLLPCPADEVSGHVVDLTSWFGSTVELRERLAAAAIAGQRVALLENWVGRHLRRRPARDVDAAVRAIEVSGGSAALPRVASDAGISLRQLERRFHADVGLSPKMFARLVRLQCALRAVSAGEPLASAAIACGYYDQPHMARDFGRLAATSPAAWRTYAGELTPLFVRPVP